MVFHIIVLGVCRIRKLKPEGMQKVLKVHRGHADKKGWEHPT